MLKYGWRKEPLTLSFPPFAFNINQSNACLYLTTNQQDSSG